MKDVNVDVIDENVIVCVEEASQKWHVLIVVRFQDGLQRVANPYSQHVWPALLCLYIL